MSGSPKPGNVYTLSGQESVYASDIWEVLEVNGTHALIKSATRGADYMRPFVVLTGRFKWTEAAEMLVAFKEANHSG